MTPTPEPTKAQLSKDLKPCPFCWCDSRLLYSHDSGQWFVWCQKCLCQGPKRSHKENCAKGWNTRAQADANDKLVSELKDQIKSGHERERVLREELAESQRMLEMRTQDRNSLHGELMREKAESFKWKEKAELDAARRTIRGIAEYAKEHRHHHVVRAIYNTALSSIPQSAEALPATSKGEGEV